MERFLGSYNFLMSQKTGEPFSLSVFLTFEETVAST